MSDATLAALEAAVRTHVADEEPGSPLVADWYLVAAHVGDDLDVTDYLTESSNAPPHVLLGLIAAGHRLTELQIQPRS